MPAFDLKYLKNKLQVIIEVKKEGKSKNQIKNFEEHFQIG